jgi:DNA-binding response OmpR family regulator
VITDINVLVIEDSSFFQQLSRRDQGYRTKINFFFSKTLDLFKIDRYIRNLRSPFEAEVILISLSDIQNILELVKHLRHSGVPIIVTSPKLRSSKLRAEILGDGADDCFPPSISKEEILARIRRSAYRYIRVLEA